VRRLGVVGFAARCLCRAGAAPVFGTDFGKGAVRWLRWGFALQPSEFLKPGFVIVTAWLMAAAQDLNGPPGKLISFGSDLIVVGFLAMQPDFGQSALVSLPGAWSISSPGRRWC
jgi:cell division protein FtsW